MNFELQKFSIGMMDFFSILLPGALPTYLLMGEVGPVALVDRYATLAGAEAWAAFLFAIYLFGHRATSSWTVSARSSSTHLMSGSFCAERLKGTKSAPGPML